jgi:hypothetical protein
VVFPFGIFTVPLQDVQASATYVGGPATSLINGLIVGFLSESDANNIVLPEGLSVLSGRPVSDLLPGGANNGCPTTAKDIGPGGQPGWYFYLNFNRPQGDLDRPLRRIDRVATARHPSTMGC